MVAMPPHRTHTAPAMPGCATEAAYDRSGECHTGPLHHAFMPFVIQNISIGVAVMQNNRPQRVFPALGSTTSTSGSQRCSGPAGSLTFFKTGPLAHNGVLAFWTPVIILCIWMLVMPWAARVRPRDCRRGARARPTA
jgi:hypothetical protein